MLSWGGFPHSRDSNLKVQVVSYLENEGRWKLGTFPKTKKLLTSIGSNFKCKLKEKGHGPLNRWIDF
jgi:hypothetical protein